MTRVQALVADLLCPPPGEAGKPIGKGTPGESGEFGENPHGARAGWLARGGESVAKGGEFVAKEDRHAPGAADNSPLFATHSPPFNPSRTRAIAGNSPNSPLSPEVGRVEGLPKANAPPPLAPADREAIQEAIEERAGILEFDAGLPRHVAETQAAEAMRVYRYRLTDRPDWLILIAPGCTLADARRALFEKFGAAWLLDLAPHPDPTETAPY